VIAAAGDKTRAARRGSFSAALRLRGSSNPGFERAFSLENQAFVAVFARHE
jgi:hypothetical protein